MSKTLTILGAGESGIGAALLAKAKDYEVFVSDFGDIAPYYRQQLVSAEIDFEERGHSEQRILKSDLVVKSPGIPETAPIIKALRAAGNLIISEIEFAAKYTGAKLIGITGTNGKTTTTLLTCHLLKEAGFNAGAAGNLGHSFARQVLEHDFDWYVLELSSFQLDDSYDLKLDIAVLLNVTPDHLDRYDHDFEKYRASKMRIFQIVKPGGDAIFYKGNPAVRANIGSVSKGLNVHSFSIGRDVADIAYIQNDRLFYDAKGAELSVPAADISIKGLHNMLNAAAAGSAALLAGASPKALRRGLKRFRNAPNRLERVCSLDGVNYINDSKATNVDAVYFALEAMGNPVVWIAGGVDKGNDYRLLDTLVQEKVRALICLGKDNSRLRAAFENLVPEVKATDDVMKAVRMAQELAKPGDTVLLAPACASFDLFVNYEDRGDQFKQAVLNLRVES